MGVVGVKTGIKAFGEGNREPITKSDNLQTVSAHDKDKVGQDDIGALLNKIADPNWVDPNKKVRAVGNDKLDKDAFMKLMLAQMKNQDPTNPLKSHEMAAQLAQFTSVEQMMNMNQTLTDLKNAQKPQESFQALNFIGKAVSGDSANLVRVKGDKEHDFSFILGDDAKDVDIRIRNSNGEVVRTVNLKDLKKGENKWNWNGQDERGVTLPAGEYKFFAEGKNSAGKKIGVKTDFAGTITGVNYTPEGPVLLVGTQSVKLKDVKKIVDPSLVQKDKSAVPVSAQPAAETSAAEGAPDAEPAPQAQIMNSVGMSSGMMAKLEKESQPQVSEKNATNNSASGPLGANEPKAPVTLKKPEIKPETKKE